MIFPVRKIIKVTRFPCETSTSADEMNVHLAKLEMVLSTEKGKGAQEAQIRGKHKCPGIYCRFNRTSITKEEAKVLAR